MTKRSLLILLGVIVVVVAVAFYMKWIPMPGSKVAAKVHWICDLKTVKCHEKAKDEKLAKGQMDFFPASGVKTEKDCLAECAKEAKK